MAKNNKAAKSAAEPASNATASAPAKRKVPALAKTRWHFADHARNYWRVVLDQGRPYSDVFDIDFWFIVETNLTAGDLVEVVDDANTIFALLYVRQYVRFSQIDLVELIRRDMVADRPIEREGWRVEYRGPQLRWCVVDPAGVVKRDGLFNMDAALVQMAAFQQTHSLTPQRIVG
jgi:hypothetical protein